MGAKGFFKNIGIFFCEHTYLLRGVLGSLYIDFFYNPFVVRQGSRIFVKVMKSRKRKESKGFDETKEDSKATKPDSVNTLSEEQTTAKKQLDSHQEDASEKKSPRWRRILVRTVLGVFLAPLLLLFLIIGLLYVPPIQDAVVQAVENKVNKGGEVHLSIGSLRLGFPLKVKLKETTLLDARGDTMLQADALSLRVSLLPLLSGIVESDRLRAENLSFNLSNKDYTTLTSLSAKSLELAPLSANLSHEMLDVGTIAISEGHFLFSDRDTTKQEPSAPFPWHLSVSRVKVNDFDFELDMPNDSLLVKAPLHRFEAEKLWVAVDSLDVHSDWLCAEAKKAYYANDRIVPKKGVVDYSRIYADELHFEAKNFQLGEDLLAFDVQSMKVKEQSGAIVNDLQGDFKLQDKVITVQSLDFLSPKSQLQGDIRLPLEIFKGNESEPVVALIKGQLSLEDFIYFSGVELKPDTPVAKKILADFAKEPIALDIDISGPSSNLAIKRLTLGRKGYFDLSLDGEVNSPLDSKKIALSAHLKSRVQPHAKTLLALASPSLAKRLSIPSNTSLLADLKMKNGRYQGDLKLSAPHTGNIHIQGNYSSQRKSYRVALQSKNFRIDRFLPSDSIGETTLQLLAQGRGFDLFKPSTHHQVMMELERTSYKGHPYKGVSLEGKLKNKEWTLDLESRIPDALMNLAMEGQIDKHWVRGELQANVEKLELKNLGVSQDSTLINTCLNATFSTDLKQEHHLELSADSLLYYTPTLALNYDRIALDASVAPHTSALNLFGGDLALSIEINEGVNTLGRRVARVNKAVHAVLQDSLKGSNLSFLLGELPEAKVHFSMARENPLSQILAEKKLFIGTTSLDLTTKPQERNFDLEFFAQNIRKDTLLVDSVYLQLYRDYTSRTEASLLSTIASNFSWEGTKPRPLMGSRGTGDDLVLRLNGALAKKAYRNQPATDIQIKAGTDLETLELDVSYKENNQTLHKVGAWAFRNGNGYGLSLKPETLFVMGKPLIPNTNNAVFYKTKEKSIKASLYLQTEGSGSVELRSVEEEGEDGDKINLIIKNFKLSLLNGMAGLDRLEGNTFADVMVEEDLSTKKLRVIGDLSINDFTYDGTRLGHISTALFYEPSDKYHHYINAQVSHNGDLAFSLDGKYDTSDKESPIDANVEIQSFSLPLLNPFIGQENAKLSGFVDGKVKVTGSPSKICLHGALEPDAVFAFVPAVGEIFAIESKPILLEGNQVKLEEIQLRPVKQEKPLTLHGTFNLFEPNASYADLQIKGNEVTILDSKRGKGQILYGKLIISPDITLRGKLSSPTIMGGIDLVGGTNATFVNTKSKLKAKNNMAGVVVFTDFADTLFVNKETPVLPLTGGANIALNVHIDPAVRLGVDLDEGHQDYATLQGGGDLRLRIPPYSEMSLIGNFDISGGGEVRYDIPVVGRKNFNIDPSSRITWTGDILRPSISFKAIHRVRAEVVENKQSRKVDFNVLIFAKEVEDGYDIAFGLEAPSDLAIQNQLATMSEEERGKQAIALMVSGSFLAGEATEANMQKILSNLAVSELNNLTGKFLQGTDFSVGMELHDASETGAIYTDYSYSFSKRFFNDRIRVVFGGRVAAGNLPSNYEQTFIDNVTLEYRLDKAGNQYITLFHKRNNDNLFEGLVTETGISYILRKKLVKLGDLFKKDPLKRSEKTLPGDSLRATTVVPDLSTKETKSTSEKEENEGNKPLPNTPLASTLRKNGNDNEKSSDE